MFTPLFLKIRNKTKLLTISILAINYNMTSKISIIQLPGKLVRFSPVPNVSPFILSL